MIRKILKIAVCVFLVLLLLLSLGGYFGTLNRYLELSSNFKAQYLVFSLFLLILSALSRLKYWVLLALMLVSLNSYEVLPVYFADIGVVGGKEGYELTLIQSNVSTTYGDQQKFIEIIKREAPDLIILQEVNTSWLKALTAIEGTLPYKKVIPGDDSSGIALYSRWPFKDLKVVEFGGVPLPAINVKTVIFGREVELLAIHTFAPINFARFSDRNAQLLEVASFVEDMVSPKILVGDMNVTMWSPFFRKLLNATGLIDVRIGHGLVPTWPTFMPLFMIPIDQCLVSADIKVQGIKTENFFGSDHLPFIVKLKL